MITFERLVCYNEVTIGEIPVVTLFSFRKIKNFSNTLSLTTFERLMCYNDIRKSEMKLNKPKLQRGGIKYVQRT